MPEFEMVFAKIDSIKNSETKTGKSYFNIKYWDAQAKESHFASVWESNLIPELQEAKDNEKFAELSVKLTESKDGTKVFRNIVGVSRVLESLDGVTPLADRDELKDNSKTQTSPSKKQTYSKNSFKADPDKTRSIERQVSAKEAVNFMVGKSLDWDVVQFNVIAQDIFNFIIDEQPVSEEEKADIPF